MGIIDTASNQIFPCSEWKNEGNGTYSVMLQGVTAGENIDVTISGEQYLARDAYFYEPVSGRHAAQCFVGVAEGSTPVFARGSFRIDEKTERLAYLSEKKTSNRAGTYKFNVYKAENDTKELINTVEITTAEANTCVASEKILLPAGTYIVEEEDAIKAGYTLIVTVDGTEHTVNSENEKNIDLFGNIVVCDRACCTGIGLGIVIKDCQVLALNNTFFLQPLQKIFCYL